MRADVGVNVHLRGGALLFDAMTLKTADRTSTEQSNPPSGTHWDSAIGNVTVPIETQLHTVKTTESLYDLQVGAVFWIQEKNFPSLVKKVVRDF